MTDYDPAENSRRCYDLAIRTIRLEGVLSGKYEPKDDEERAMLREAQT